jgi:Tfp pilus assembly protein PilN
MMLNLRMIPRSNRKLRRLLLTLETSAGLVARERRGAFIIHLKAWFSNDDAAALLHFLDTARRALNNSF